MKKLLCGLNQGRLAGTELLVDLLKGFDGGIGTVFSGKSLALVLFERSDKTGILAEQLKDILSVCKTECANENGKGELAVLVYTNVHNSVDIAFIFEPSASVRNYLSRVGLFTCLVYLGGIVHTGGADKLGNYNSFSTVDNEGAVFGHKREITEIDIGIFHVTCLLVGKTNVYLQGRSIVNVTLLALLNGILGLGIDRIRNEVYRKITRVVGDRGNVTQHFHESFLKEPFKGFRLDLNEVGKLQIES